MKVLFVGPVGEYSVTDGGYGNASTGIVFVLKKMLKNKLISELKVVSTLDFKNADSVKPGYDVCICVTHPSSFENGEVKEIFKNLIKNAEKKYLSVVWETSILPKIWDWLWEDEMFDGFLSPSKFIGDMICKKTKKPVYYYPHFINIDFFTPPEKRDLNEFKVLIIGQHTLRKNLIDSVIAYVRGLHLCEDSSLIIKFHRMSGKEINFEPLLHQTIQTNCDKNKMKAKIFTLDEQLSSKDIVKLYQEASLVLCLSRGEGFGLTAGEGMASGLPIIYTNWSALPEVAESEVNIPISYMLDSSSNMHHYGYEHNSLYAIPKIHDAEQALIFMYNEWKENPMGYYKKASLNRDVIDKKFGYEAIKNYLMDIIRGENR